MKLGLKIKVVASSVVLFSSPLLTLPALAYESDEGYGYSSPTDQESTNEIAFPDDNDRRRTEGTRFEKFQLALQTLKIPAEKKPDFSDFENTETTNSLAVLKNLPFIDPDGVFQGQDKEPKGLSGYLRLQSGTLELFKDFFSETLPRSYLEYSTSFSDEASGSSKDSEELLSRLQRIALQVKTGGANTPPLAGFRVLIDPGHMGGREWDAFTGKWVEYYGLHVSEGELTLWTALLVAKELEALGATVKLTRQTIGTVTSSTYENFDPTPYRNQYFYNSLDGWMDKYLKKLTNAQIQKELSEKPEVKAADTEKTKKGFFSGGEDLEARSLMIDEFHPDMILDIHYDAKDNRSLQSSNNSIEAFVPGGFTATETGSRHHRSFALKHLLEVRRWNESVEMAASVTQAMSQSLRLPLLKSPKLETAIRVRDGVYARNLYINRRAREGLVVYLECLHYDHTSEFRNMARKNAQARYRSVKFNYPSRINEVVTGIRAGILNYFKNFQTKNEIQFSNASYEEEDSQSFEE